MPRYVRGEVTLLSLLLWPRFPWHARVQSRSRPSRATDVACTKHSLHWRTSAWSVGSGTGLCGLAIGPGTLRRLVMHTVTVWKSHTGRIPPCPFVQVPVAASDAVATSTESRTWAHARAPAPAAANEPAAARCSQTPRHAPHAPAPRYGRGEVEQSDNSSCTCPTAGGSASCSLRAAVVDNAQLRAQAAAVQRASQALVEVLHSRAARRGGWAICAARLRCSAADDRGAAMGPDPIAWTLVDCTTATCLPRTCRAPWRISIAVRV